MAVKFIQAGFFDSGCAFAQDFENKTARFCKTGRASSRKFSADAITTRMSEWMSSQLSSRFSSRSL
jgi:hypothetical protein